MNVFLFGPPGIGKSTIVEKFVSKGYVALDLEKFWRSNRSVEQNRGNLMRIVDAIWFTGDIHGVFGAAGLDPRVNYPGAKVLLVLDEERYQARRAIRDQRDPRYAKQAPQQVASWLNSTKWDYVVGADGDAFRVIAQIASLSSDLLSGVGGS